MKYFKKEVIKGVVNYYAVKDQATDEGGYLVIRCGDPWYNIDTGRFLPINLVPIREAEFVERWMNAMARFETFLPKPF